MLKIFLLFIFFLFNNVYNVHASYPQVATDLEKIRLASVDIVQMSISCLDAYDIDIKEFKSLLHRQTSETTSESTELEKKRVSADVAKLRIRLAQGYRTDRELRISLDRYKSGLEKLSKILNFIHTHQHSSCATVCDGQIALLSDSIPVNCLLQNNIEAANNCLFSILQSLEEMKSSVLSCNQKFNSEKDAFNMAAIKSLIRKK